MITATRLPLTHLPSGHFPANAAWLALAAICHNLTRAAGCLAGAFFAKARGATVRGQLIAVAARIARRGRGHITMHLPEGWHRQTAWMSLFQAACGVAVLSVDPELLPIGLPEPALGSTPDPRHQKGR